MKYLLILCSFTFSNFQSAYSNSIQVDPQIREDLDKQGYADAFIILKQQADLSPAKNIRDKHAKGKYVYNTLLKHARTHQASLIQWFEKENITYTSFYISNGIFIQLKPSMLESLLLRDDIKAITANPSFPISPTTNAPSLREKALGAWGIAKVKADSAWILGFEGQGVVVAGQDTGYEWFHPSIQKKYRGYNSGNEAQHDYNWHDAIHQIDSMHGDSIIMPENNPCGLDATVPCDDHSHGTHTMATMVGETDEEIFGLAPKATWIGCRCMERGYGTPFTYLECFEWFLAPSDVDGNNPDPSQAPHVINNSWGCPEIEGCNQSNFELLNLAIKNLRSAGVVVVVSAGNGGRQGCATVDDPPAIYDGSFAVGATDINDTIAPFSSKGPVLVDGSNRTKPNISAPGVGIRSAVRGGGYAAWSGTSMAGPHVAGAVALLISAVPELAGQVEEIETLLEETADPLTTLDSCGIIPGTEIPNLTYGHGRLNVYKAIQKALSQYSSTREIELRSFSIYPNPGNGIVKIKWEDNLYFERLLVFDGLGRILIDKPINNQPSLFLETDHLEAGIYWVELYNQGQRAIKKYIKL